MKYNYSITFENVNGLDEYAVRAARALCELNSLTADERDFEITVPAGITAEQAETLESVARFLSAQQNICGPFQEPWRGVKARWREMVSPFMSRPEDILEGVLEGRITASDSCDPSMPASLGWFDKGNRRWINAAPMEDHQNDTLDGLLQELRDEPEDIPCYFSGPDGFEETAARLKEIEDLADAVFSVTGSYGAAHMFGGLEGMAEKLDKAGSKVYNPYILDLVINVGGKTLAFRNALRP